MQHYFFIQWLNIKFISRKIMILLIKYPPEGSLKQNHQYMVLKSFYALHIVHHKTFGRVSETKSTELLI